jgi:nucleotide-binding universal stress UspA family protein
MKVLLATDGSKFSEAATEAIISQCQPQGTEVRVLNVVDLPLLIPTLYAAEFREESLKHGEELVRQAERPLAKAGYKVETAVEEGDPKSRIVEDAAAWHADLIVLGSHGRKGIDRFLMGSVSEAVSHHAPCSVQIVRISTNGHAKSRGRSRKSGSR